MTFKNLKKKEKNPVDKGGKMVKSPYLHWSALTTDHQLPYSPEIWVK